MWEQKNLSIRTWLGEMQHKNCVKILSEIWSNNALLLMGEKRFSPRGGIVGPNNRAFCKLRMSDILGVENVRHSESRECLTFWKLRMSDILEVENVWHSHRSSWKLRMSDILGVRGKPLISPCRIVSSQFWCNIRCRHTISHRMVCKLSNLEVEKNRECLAFSTPRMSDILNVQNVWHSRSSW